MKFWLATLCIFALTAAIGFVLWLLDLIWKKILEWTEEHSVAVFVIILLSFFGCGGYIYVRDNVPKQKVDEIVTTVVHYLPVIFILGIIVLLGWGSGSEHKKRIERDNAIYRAKMSLNRQDQQKLNDDAEAVKKRSWR